MWHAQNTANLLPVLCTMSDFVMNFSDSIHDIEAALRKYRLPVVVKSENVCPEKKKKTYWDEEIYQNS